MVEVKIDDGHDPESLRAALDAAEYQAVVIREGSGGLCLEVPDGLDVLTLDLFAQAHRRRELAQKVKEAMPDEVSAAAVDELLG